VNGPSSLLRLVGGYAQVNAQRALEYRSSLVSQAAGMLINNIMWVTFWAAYFDRFSLPHWSRADVISLWALASVTVGVANAFFGNAVRLAGIIERGELDFYLALPKPVLLHVLVGHMKLVALGDIAFGVLAFAVFRRPGIGECALFALGTATGATVVVAFSVVAGSLAFWLGRAETLAGFLYNGLINFSLYPRAIFRGSARVMLYTVIPAAFIAAMPVELLQQPRASLALELVAVAVGMAALATIVFRVGLRRYTSGNLLALRE